MGDGALWGLTGLPGPGGHAPISQTAGGGRGAGGELRSGPESQSRPKAWASRLPLLLAQERSGSGEEVNMPPLMGREREQVGQPAGQTRLLPRPPGHLLSPSGPLATLRVPLGLPGPLQGPSACPAPRLMGGDPWHHPPGSASGRGDHWVGQALWSHVSPPPRPPPTLVADLGATHTTRGCLLLVAGSGLPELALHCPAPRTR